jgi:hypothetical protein
MSTEKVIEDLVRQCARFGTHRPHYDRGKARAHFLNVAKQKKPRRRAPINAEGMKWRKSLAQVSASLH